VRRSSSTVDYCATTRVSWGFKAIIVLSNLAVRVKKVEARLLR
jgi:hypothetical protein